MLIRLLTALLSAGLIAGEAHALVPVIEDGAPELLIIRSEGFSRFEIEGDDIVGRIVGGVEFEYMGYRLAADELSYNHAARRAEALGSISMSGSGFGARGERIVMDGATGRIALEGEIDGHLQQQGFSFSAEAVAITFAEDDFDLRKAGVRVSGGVRANVPDYGTFESDTLTYDGASGEFSSPGPFVAELDAAQLGAFDTPGEESAPQPASLRGTSFSGELREGRGVVGLEVVAPVLEAQGYRLTGNVLRMRDDTTSAEPRWRVSVEGEPVRGHVSGQQGEQYALESTEIDLVIDEEGLRNINLSGGVVLAAEQIRLVAGELWLERGRDGQLIARGRDLDGDFNLALLAGIEPVELAELMQSR